VTSRTNLRLAAMTALLFSFAGCAAPAQSASAASPASAKLQGALGPGTPSALFAIHLPKTPTEADVEVFVEQVKKRIPDVPYRAKTGPMVGVLIPSPQDIAPLDPEMLALFSRGLDEKAQEALLDWPGVALFGMEVPDDPGRKRLRVLQELAVAMAKKHGGAIWDDSTREMFSPEVFEERRVAGWEGGLCDVRRHVTIHFYAVAGQRHRMITLGMRKLGLPDLVIQDVAPPHADRAAMLLNATAQLLLEGAPLLREGKLDIDLRSIKHTGAKSALPAPDDSKTVTIDLVRAEREQGDPANRLFAVDVGAFKGRSDGEKLGALLDTLFGDIEDPVTPVASDDPEILAIKKRVQAKVPELAARVKKGLSGRESLSVKAPFDTDDGGIEWMWVEVVSWEGDTIRGHLDSTPVGIASLASGARVAVDAKTISDYLFRKDDGTFEGGESVKLFLARQRKNKKKTP
jgi:uncharacterized protein YegJ (DUF2314 family)